MKPKKYFSITLLVTLTIFVVPAIIVTVIDPFFVIHKKLSADIGFDGTDRYQNAGLINSFLADPAERFDTIILGTSMSQNFPVSAFKNEFGRNALKLTLAGGRARELGTIARKAIATGRVKRVVWEIFTSFADENPDATHKNSPLPLFLYNDTLADNWRYVFNNDVFENAFKIVRGKIIKKKKVKRSDLEGLYTWAYDDQFRKYSEKPNLAKLYRKVQASNLPIPASPPETMRPAFPNLQKNLFPILRENPNIEFMLYFPPISHYAYAVYGHKKFWRQMLMRKNLLEETQELKNVHVYGFDLNENISGSLQNYMDPNHYSPAVNADMAKAMVKYDRILTAQDWKSYTRALVRKVNSFAENFRPP